jgi:glycosyltransferase involved in cell wall biosynthesis
VPKPRFSVLLPTRNGGALLGGCVRSILDQPYADLELVVSDNANTDETPAVLSGFAGDPRLKVLRQERVLSVTENWTATLEASTGDYVLMLGDDDLLRRGYFEQVDAALERHGEPECLTYNGVRYVAPGAIEGSGSSLWTEPYFFFEPALSGERDLPAPLRAGLVRDMYRLHLRFPLTMQVTVASREAITRLPNGLFRSPFPDHYAIGGLLLTAQTWALSPIRPIIVGVSLRSFGRYFFESRDTEGLRYLGVKNHFQGALPGNEALNTQVAWLKCMRDDFDDVLEGMDVDRGEYVLRQAWTWLRELGHRRLEGPELGRRLQLLTLDDLRAALKAIVRRGNPRLIMSAVRRQAQHRGNRSGPLQARLEPLPDIRDISGFAAWLDGRA